jgi:NAD+ synthase
MPYETLDMLLFAWENHVSSEEAGKVMQLRGEQVERAFRDFEAKHKATEHARMLPPSLI